MTPWTVAHQAPLSMEFTRQEYWSGLPFPSPEDLPDPGIEPGFPALQADCHLSLQGSHNSSQGFRKSVSRCLVVFQDRGQHTALLPVLIYFMESDNFRTVSVCKLLILLESSTSPPLFCFVCVCVCVLSHFSCVQFFATL